MEEEEEGGDFVVGYQGKVERPGKRMLPFQLPPPRPPPSPDRQILERHTRTHRKKRGKKGKRSLLRVPDSQSSSSSWEGFLLLPDNSPVQSSAGLFRMISPPLYGSKFR